MKGPPGFPLPPAPILLLACIGRRISHNHKKVAKLFVLRGGS
jgi:hypothetical protein